MIEDKDKSEACASNLAALRLAGLNRIGLRSLRVFGALAVLMMVIMINGCGVVGGGSGEGEKFGRAFFKVLQSTDSGDMDKLLEQLVTREMLISHVKSVKMNDMSDGEMIRLRDEAMFNESMDQALVGFGSITSKMEEDRDAETKKMLIDLREAHKWGDAELVSVVWDYDEEFGLKSGPVYIRVKFSDEKEGYLVINEFSISKYEGKAWAYMPPILGDTVRWVEFPKDQENQ